MTDWRQAVLTTPSLFGIRSSAVHSRALCSVARALCSELVVCGCRGVVTVVVVVRAVMLRRLEGGHRDWVRGVAWDPVGKYLASESQDGVVVVWSVAGSAPSDWSVVQVIDEYRLQFGNTKTADMHRQMAFNRLSWSPNGDVLAVSRVFLDVLPSCFPAFLPSPLAPGLH
jgi:WD40 repeat protein